MSNIYASGADHPELIEFCQRCTREDCEGFCEDYRDRYRDLYNLPPINRHERVHRPRTEPLRAYNKLYFAFGEEHTLSEWAKLYGMKYATLYMRVADQHWTLEQALSTPAATYNRHDIKVTIDGETKPISRWAMQYGIARATVYSRIKRGMEPIDALTKPVVYTSEVRGLHR